MKYYFETARWDSVRDADDTVHNIQIITATGKYYPTPHGNLIGDLHTNHTLRGFFGDNRKSFTLPDTPAGMRLAGILRSIWNHDNNDRITSMSFAGYISGHLSSPYLLRRSGNIPQEFSESEPHGLIPNTLYSWGTESDTAPAIGMMAISDNLAVSMYGNNGPLIIGSPYALHYSNACRTPDIMYTYPPAWHRAENPQL